MEYSKNIELLLDILRDEVRGDMRSALEKMAATYSMTWVYKKGEQLFPKSSPDPSTDMSEAYPIKGRRYEIKNIAEGGNVVMIEMVESYPDPKTGEIYRTPQVIVCEIKDGKIALGRHYCDPDLSWLNLTEEQVSRAYPESPTKLVISE